MIIDIPINCPSEIGIYLEQHQEVKQKIIQELAENFKEQTKNLDITEKDTDEGDNKFVKFAKAHARIDADKLGDTDIGQIIRDNHEDFKESFAF